MERESNPMQALCRSGCGFYGNPSTDGLCSLCYKEALKKKQQPPSNGPSPSSYNSSSSLDTGIPTIPVIPSGPNQSPLFSQQDQKDFDGEGLGSGAQGGLGEMGASGAPTPGSDSPDPTNPPDPNLSDKDSEKEKAKKKNRCAVCRKKLGLTGFECRCGGLYCGVHRYSDKHECTFNYRELGAQEIRRNNPVVVGEKIHKI